MRHWTKQTPFTDPGENAAMLATIGPEPERVIAAIQGLLIHGGAVEYYGLAQQEFSRETLSVDSRLGAILTEDDRPLSVERAPQDRALGTCRDYAVLVCAAMREHGRPARVRCGFASYLGGAMWEDHWLCELWS
ncbi:MAG: transglutaminase domain-containing protein, partial [Phenylobacterium sp.]|nr:transglutaminase domain-containing protein [Phenylobacterium sp.]